MCSPFSDRIDGRRAAGRSAGFWRLAVSLCVTILAVTAGGESARADGGAGSGTSPYGGAGGSDNPTGAGGAGAVSSTGGGGGGGAGSTGGAGGIGDFGNGGAGGAGGTMPGASGGDGSFWTSGGGGGGGGAHGHVGATLLGTAMTGGNGGNGGGGGDAANALDGDGGGGGAGGYGAVVTGSGNLGTLSVNVTGGNGGAGGRSDAPSGGFYGGNGGSGGIGLDLTDTSGTILTVNSIIRGGNGGARGTSVSNGASDPGIGGVGIIGGNLNITVGGSVIGGLSGDGVTRANAITFNGGTNTLELLSSAIITGNVVAASAADTLILGGTTNGTFDVALAGTQYQGFGAYAKTGTSTWTLTGTTANTIAWTVSGGTLSVGNLTNFSPAPSSSGLGLGAITLDGGKLLTTSTGSLANDITFAAGKTSTLAAATGTTLTIGGDTSVVGNQPARIILGANAVAQFGSATDTGVISIGASSNINLSDIDPTSRMVIAGGTVRDVQDQLFNLTAGVSSITINAGATLDFNDSGLQALVNLGGAGNVMTGTTGNNTLSIFTTTSSNTFAGVISGVHPVSFDTTGGAATMILTGDNTYTGGTTICSCVTLQLGNGGTTGSIVGDVVNENKLIFNRSSTYTFNGVISDIGEVIQNGTGNTVLTATHGYTGNTIVNAGTLSVNGDIRASSGVIVNTGGTLGGTGFVPDTQIRTGGTLAPGNSIGTLNVAGNLQFSTGSTYAIEVSPAAADRVNVSGTATLGGAAVTAAFAPGAYVAKQYTILNAGSITGRFGSLTTSNMPNTISAALSYGASDVYLDLTLSFVLPNGLNANQQNVANALTRYFDMTGGIPTTFTALSANGLGQVSGETATGSQQMTFDAINQFMGIMTDPFTAGRGGSAPNAMSYAEEDALAYAADGRRRSRPEREAYAMFTKALPKIYEARWNIWAAGFGGSRATDGSGALGSNNTTSSIYGTAVGADYWLSPTTVAGVSMAGGGTNFSVANGGSGRSDLVQAGAFVRHSEGSAYITAAAAYGWQSITTDRLVVAGVTDRLHAAFNANAYSGRIEAGNRWVLPTLGGIGVTPYAAVQVTALDLPAYAETSGNGAGTFGLTYAGKTVTDTRSELGLRSDKSFALDDGLLTLRGRAAWAHDFNTDRSIAATFQSLPGASFIVNGALGSREAALASVSAEMKWSSGWAVAATFDGEFSDATRSYAGKGVVRYAW